MNYVEWRRDMKHSCLCALEAEDRNEGQTIVSCSLGGREHLCLSPLGD